MSSSNLAASIDLGTNTAHILIASKDSEKLKIIKKKRHYVFLAESGVDFISREAEIRLFRALEEFDHLIKSNNIDSVFVTATEVFRKAQNGQYLIDKITAKYAWKPHVISGDREAELIFNGVRAYMDMSSSDYIIMDIGGGSVEFILVNRGTLGWKRSFPIGIAALYNLGEVNDPMTQVEIQNIKNQIRSHLAPLSERISQYPDIQLVGAAGSFEILARPISVNSDRKDMIESSNLIDYMNQLKGLDKAQRAELTWITADRAMYVVMAIVLIEVTLEITKNDRILVSPYALKEGVLAEHFNILD